MKKGIHPEYRPVIFKDATSDFAFLGRSTLQTDRRMMWTDGKEYPVFTAEITSDSHPFFTGKQKIVDTEGRVEKFMQKYGMKKKS
ncbi:MAG: type B 50S ribosomal protein L31 [Capsulimonadales bacterium]|nr:type B 50S ribosomal protein L31 [Capsulimonadales bacterium]